MTPAEINAVTVWIHNDHGAIVRADAPALVVEAIRAGIAKRVAVMGNPPRLHVPVGVCDACGEAMGRGRSGWCELCGIARRKALAARTARAA